MALQWTISHDERLVTMTGEDFISLQELEEFYDALVIDNALSYGRLFDISRLGDRVASDEDFMKLGARMSAYKAVDFKFGPLAYVVTSPPVLELVRRSLNLAPADRPVRIFSTVSDARAWLKAQLGVAASA